MRIVSSRDRRRVSIGLQVITDRRTCERRLDSRHPAQIGAEIISGPSRILQHKQPWRAPSNGDGTERRWTKSSGKASIRTAQNVRQLPYQPLPIAAGLQCYERLGNVAEHSISGHCGAWNQELYPGALTATSANIQHGHHIAYVKPHRRHHAGSPAETPASFRVRSTAQR